MLFSFPTAKRHFPHRRPSSQGLATLLALSLALPAAPRAHSEPIPYSQALEQALQTAQMSRRQDAAREKAEGLRQAAATLPNPSLFYQQEALKGSSSDENDRESLFGVSAPLDFLWKRTARIQTAESRAQIDTLHIEAEERAIARQVAVLFVEYRAATLESERHEAAHHALNEARRIAAANVDAGESPPTLLRRVDLAIARHAFEEADVQSRLLEIQTRFSALLGNSDAIPQSDGLRIAAPRFPDAAAARNAALAKRPELKAASAYRDWKEAESTQARREGLPGASLEAGRKEDGAGRDGSYIGVSVELPLFNRNQAAARIALAETREAEVALDRARREIEGIAVAAFQRWNQLEQNWQRLSESLQAISNASELLRSIEASFEAGEASLLDYLDAIDSFLDASHNEIELQKALRTAAIDLAHATATELSFHFSSK